MTSNQSSVDDFYELVFPLFDFYYEGLQILDQKDVTFIDEGIESSEFNLFENIIKIRRFNVNTDFPDYAKQWFSPIEKPEIESANWAISMMLRKGNKDDGYKEELNLLLLTLRIFFKANCKIKYQMCINGGLPGSGVINRELMCDALVTEPSIIWFDNDKLILLRKYFNKVYEFYNISYRTANAFWFIYLGYVTYYGSPAFTHLISALESLYLVPLKKKEKYRIKETLKKRIIDFLDNDQIATSDIIDGLYEYRSKIIHGKIKAEEIPNDEDFRKIFARTQLIVIETIRKIIDNDLGKTIYEDEDGKPSYFESIIKS